MIEEKKQNLKDEIKSLDEDRINLELEIEEKRKQIESTQGSDSLGKEDLDKFNENLNKKIQEEKKLKEDLKELDQETSILKRTEAILKKELKKAQNKVKDYE